MRKVLGLAVLASTVLATAAHADGNLPFEGAKAGATTKPATLPTTLGVPLLPPIQHLDLMKQAPTGGDDPSNRLNGAIRHRFGSAMIDLYPSDSSGFHLSVGTRFVKKQYFLRDQQEATHGLLYSPRVPRGVPGMRGFRRATPAATFGYTHAVDSKFALGLEAGALLGGAVEPMPSSRGLAGVSDGLHDSRSMQMNPLVNLTVGYAF